MICPQCGVDSDKSVRFCTGCGSALATNSPGADPSSAGAERADSDRANLTTTGAAPERVGWSPRIDDPAFARYLSHSKLWSFGFAAILAVAAIAGFYIYGETSSEMDNPEALYIGLAIGGMFLLIALFQALGRSRSRTWDGVVVDKKIEKKQHRQGSGQDQHWVSYKLYTVVFQSDDGKRHEQSAEDDTTVYDYYQIGDRVRHHRGLNSMEKYDKSRDQIIFCSACASLNDIEADTCFRCSCPLLK